MAHEVVEGHVQSRLEIAKEWLLHSGIQNLDGGKMDGSFHAWHDLSSNTFSFSYSEITGYGITTLLYLNSIAPEKILVERAARAADWLLATAFDHREKAILCRLEHKDGQLSPRACTFDNGMCLNGVANLYRQTTDQRHKDFAIQLGDWLLSMQKEDGSFFTRHLLTTGEFEHKGDKWSKQSGSFHAKLAIGLLNLYDLLGEEKYRISAIRLCDLALRFQQPDGRFITDELTGNTFLHPFCYTNEGLLTAAVMLDEKKYLEAVKRSVSWILSARLKSHGFSAHHVDGTALERESADINAQAIRLVILLHALGEMPQPKDFFQDALGNILSHQCLLKGNHSYGGFLSGDAWFYGEKHDHTGKHVNSWVTMFAAQALGMYLHPPKNMKHSIRYLV